MSDIEAALEDTDSVEDFGESSSYSNGDPPLREFKPDTRVNEAVSPYSIDEILRDIKCEEHIKIFQDHQLDLDTVILLEDEEIKELFPKIGQRLKFKKKIEELKNKLTSNHNQIKQRTNVATPIQVIENVKIAAGGEFEPDIPIVYQDEYNLIPNEPDVNKDEASKKSDIFQQENNRTSLDGRAILKEGQIGGGLLKEGSRRKLSQLLIYNLVEINPTKTIDTEEFCSLSTDICQLFTKESTVVYYSAYIASTDGGKKKNASGKLYESYICRRRKLREIGDLPKSNRSRSISSASTSSSISLSPEQSEEEHQENIAWLKNNVEPWETVQKNWRETEGFRLNKIKAGEGNIEGYFNDFPALQQQQGYTLLLNDFDCMFPGKSSNLFSKILLKKGDILKYARIKLKATRDKYVTSRLRELLTLVDDTNLETATNIALMVLPLVINISPTRKQKKPMWKPSRAEISQGFVSQAANEGEVTTSILEKTEKYKKLGRRVQPYVIFVGSSEVEVRKAYVVINNTLYTFQKLITAIDCAFKVFHATGAYYPEECEDIWTAIQLGMYGITTRFDRKTQAVNAILADLELTE